MSALFQGLVKEDGRVQILSSVSRPGSAVDFRGMAVTPTSEVIATPDTGQARVSINGVSFEEDTGILLLSGSAGPFDIAPGGLLVDEAGAVAYDDVTNPDVVHQGVGLLNTGRLCTSIQTMVESFLLQENGDRILLEDLSGALLLEAGNG